MRQVEIKCRRYWVRSVGIEYSKKGISVDGHLRTNVSNIYASGDVLDKDILN